jgi:CAAX protease family protein
MLLASALPDIILCQLYEESPGWVPFAQIGLLLLATVLFGFSPRWRPICGFLLTLAAIRLGWSVIKFSLVWSDSLREINLGWAAHWFVERVLALAGAVIIGLTLIGSGLTRRDLFLRTGEVDAMARPEPPFWFRPIPWTLLGPILLVIFSVTLPIFLYFSLHPDFSTSERAWHLLPWGILTAVVNAANEEFQFRCVPLARLKHLLSDREMALLTASFFGLQHYFGQPSGFIGVLLAGIAGWLWAKSLIETRGWMWAFSIHMVQDIVIFVFLAMTAPA